LVVVVVAAQAAAKVALLLDSPQYLHFLLSRGAQVEDPVLLVATDQAIYLIMENTHFLMVQAAVAEESCRVRVVWGAMSHPQVQAEVVKGAAQAAVVEPMASSLRQLQGMAVLVGLREETLFPVATLAVVAVVGVLLVVKIRADSLYQ
jgi:hypothetical protein